jgi:predicted nuclease of predicted toxin-antitoxin system
MDVGVGRAVETYLRQAGHEVYSVLDVNPSAPDEAILLMAEEQEAMVVTMDKDFGKLVFRSRRKHAGVLLLRLEEATGAEKVDVVRQILDRHGQELVGRFCVYQNGRLRIR